MKIAIIGASIAGLTAATLLKQDHQLTIYEQNPDALKNQGAGIVIPVELFNALLEQNIVNNNISAIGIIKRSIIANENNHEKLICEQNLVARALHWQTLYAQLKTNISNALIKPKKIVHIKEIQAEENYDLIIGADGHHSIIAKTICNTMAPLYAGYIAWRGTVPLVECISPEIFGSITESTVPYFVYPNGHCLMYLVVEPDTDQILINWVLYEKRTEASLQNVLSMNKDAHQYRTLARGQMDTEQKKYLHEMSSVLPKIAHEIIMHTSEPFIQPVYTRVAPHRSNAQGNTILIGDAASTLPPHTASGATKGMTDALQITAAINNNGLEGIKEWAMMRQLDDQKLLGLSNRMKDFLVMNTPDWSTMTALKFAEIWSKVIAGESWYTSNTSEK